MSVTYQFVIYLAICPLPTNLSVTYQFACNGRNSKLYKDSIWFLYKIKVLRLSNMETQEYVHTIVSYLVLRHMGGGGDGGDAFAPVLARNLMFDFFGTIVRESRL